MPPANPKARAAAARARARVEQQQVQAPPPSAPPSPQSSVSSTVKAAGIATLAGVAAALPGGVAAVAIPSAAVRATKAAELIAAFTVFMDRNDGRDFTLNRRILARRLGKRPKDLDRLAAEEQQRAQDFRRRALDRLKRDLPTALAVPDQAQRQEAVYAVLDRESRFVAMRAEAMATRSVAAADRVILREQSPTGAFWLLGKGVVRHTNGCLVLSGKYWPWAVLNRVHPPRHPGCVSSLVGYHDAVERGLMHPGDVPDVADAVRSASGIVMETEAADAVLADLRRQELAALREELDRRGWCNRGTFDRLVETNPNHDPLGRFATGSGDRGAKAEAARKRQHPKHKRAKAKGKPKTYPLDPNRTQVQSAAQQDVLQSLVDVASRAGIKTPLGGVTVVNQSCPGGAASSCTGLGGPIYLDPGEFDRGGANGKAQVLYHELGHQLWYRMPDGQRQEFMRIIGKGGQPYRQEGGNSPHEQFAEAYRTTINRAVGGPADENEGAYGLVLSPARVRQFDGFFRRVQQSTVQVASRRRSGERCVGYPPKR